MDTAKVENERPDFGEKKISDKEVIEKMTGMYENTTLTLMMAPMLLGVLLPKLKESNPEVFWGAISDTRKYVDTLKKGVAEFEQALAKLAPN